MGRLSQKGTRGMTVSWEGVVSGLGALASLVWIGFLIGAWRHRNQIAWLALQGDEVPPGGWPGLVVACAARDEAAHIELAARSLLEQDYPSLRVVAVDDRSSDATGAILDRLATDDPRLRVVHVRELPEDWIGKTHALQAAADQAEDEASWLLFTDADVMFAPGALRRAVAWSERQGIDHLAVAPEVPAEGPGERVFLLAFGLAFALSSPFWKVADPSSRVHVGVGAFNMVRTRAFRAIGGFRPLSLSIDDDLQLGRILKAAGYRSRVLLGGGAVSVRWHIGLWAMVRGLEKNFYAVTRYWTTGVVGAVFLILGLFVGPYIGVLMGPWWTRSTCGLGLVAITLLSLGIGHHGRIRWYYAALLPLGGLACAWALVRSTWITLRRGGVRWRDTLYPLPRLREHVRRREAWVRELWLSTR